MSRRTLPAAARIPPPWLERAREILHAGFTAPPTLARLADTVGVHPVYLASAFHKHYGRTIGDYVRRLRIEFACRELSSSEAPLAAVALAAGFSSQAHFSTTFKRLTDLTPLNTGGRSACLNRTQESFGRGIRRRLRPLCCLRTISVTSFSGVARGGPFTSPPGGITGAT
jgi:AraC-like DNA-binding protein